MFRPKRILHSIERILFAVSAIFHNIEQLFTMRLFFFLFGLLICGNSSIAQGFQVNFQGQKQQGMASAGTGLLMDGSALFFNPGAVAHLGGSSLNAGFSPIFANVLFEEHDTYESARTDNPMGTPFSFYGVYKKNEQSRFAGGLAVYTPFGSTVVWGSNWMGRFALTRLQLKSIFFQPTFSYKLNDKLGIGGGFVLCYGNVGLEKDLPVMDSETTSTGDSYGSARLEGTAIGYGGNFGVYYRPSAKLSLGLSYRTQVNMSVEDGMATFEVPASLEENFPDGSFSSSLPLPQVASLGIGVSPTEKLELAFDVNFVGWKAYDTLAFDYESNTASLVDTRSARLYENSFSFRLGAQYMVGEHLAIRAGAHYGITPVQDGYVTPETPDNNRISYTAGLGYAICTHFEVDASFFFTKLSREDTNLETGLSGKFTTIALVPGIGLNYKF